MPDWLIEGDPLLLLLLAAAGALCLYGWNRSRSKAWLAATIACALLAGLFVLLDRLCESDSEQLSSNVQAMAAAVKPHDFNTVFAHIAQDFRKEELDKAGFRTYCENVSRSRRVQDLIIWDFRILNLDKEKRRAEVTFLFKIYWNDIGTGEAMLRCQASFVKEPDGRWRMQTFEIYPPVGDQPLPLRR